MLKNLSTIDKIKKTTKREISFCKCEKCKLQCNTPCLGTPDDIEKIIDAGFADQIFLTDWWVGMMLNLIDRPITMFQAELIEGKGCTFFKDGLCTLHDLGLKPTEGKLSHHSTKIDNFIPKQSISWNVAKEWINPANIETIKRILVKKQNQV